MKTWVVTLLLLVFAATTLFGQSDSGLTSGLKEERDQIDADLVLIENQIQEIRKELLDIRSQFASLSSTTEGHSEAIDVFHQGIDRLEDQIRRVASDVKSDRSERLREGALQDKRLASLSASIGDLSSDIQVLADQLSDHGESLKQARDDLSEQMQATDSDLRDDVSRVDGELDRAATKRWMLLGGLIALLFIGSSALWLLRRRIGEDTHKLTAHIEHTQQALREESIQLDEKLIEMLETQIHLLEKERASAMSEEEEDHSLSLRVADELVRLGKNFSRMSEDTKGLKQLKASARRIRDTLEANGYEIVKLVGQRFNAGMRLQANFREDETIPEGEEVITRIIKPQVNFRGRVIQIAQVEVSQGTKEAT